MQTVASETRLIDVSSSCRASVFSRRGSLPSAILVHAREEEVRVGMNGMVSTDERVSSTVAVRHGVARNAYPRPTSVTPHYLNLLHLGHLPFALPS